MPSHKRGPGHPIGYPGPCRPSTALVAIRAAAANVGCFSLLAVLVYVAVEDPAIYAGMGRRRSRGKAKQSGDRNMSLGPYTLIMADEDTVLEEAMDNLKEAGQRIRATQSLMRSEGMTDGENYRDLLTRFSTALAMTEAAYLEARRRRDF